MNNSNANAKYRQGNVKNTNAIENEGQVANTNAGVNANVNTNDNVVQEAITQENKRARKARERTLTKLPNGLTAETGKKVPLDVNNPDFQDKLFELNWYLGIANPIMLPVKKNINVRQGENLVSKEVEVREFSHYEYMNVNGMNFEEWVKQQFGEEYLVDDVNNQVYTIVPKDNPPQPDPLPAPEGTTNDPEVDNPQPAPQA